MPVTGLAQDTSQVTASFHSRNVTLTPMERQDLKIKGYSAGEIARVTTALQERTIEPTYSAVSFFLDTESPAGESLFSHISETSRQTLGVQGKIRLAQSLIDYAESLKKDATQKLNQHYHSLWPERKVIVSIVDRWPESLQEQAGYIRNYWPQLSVNGGMRFDFTSTSEVCSNDYGRELSPLGYLAFFRLVKDIWFYAISTGNTCAMNRVSHLLISFAVKIADNTYEYNGSSRKNRFESVIQHELKRGILSTYDIGAFAFLLVTQPAFWHKHNNDTLKLMTNRAFNGLEEKLAPHYSQWQEQSQQDLVCKTVESEVIPSVAMTMHYLHAIHDYLMKYKAKQNYIVDTESRQISRGDYFDRITHQLSHHIPAPNWTTSHSIAEVKETLHEFYVNPIYQKLFLGTEEFKVYQKEQRRLYIRKQFRGAIKKTISQSRERKANEIKKQFKAQGFTATQDVMGNISYGEEYYEKRKQYITYLRTEKRYIETLINASIPFKATWKQMNAVYDEYKKLPIEEQRYWSMDREYAKSIVIPKLIADLTLIEIPTTPEKATAEEQLAYEHENLLELQSKFITCRCSECTICEVTRYLCKCPNGLNQRIAKRENTYRDVLLTQKIVKGVKKHFLKNFCTEGTPVQKDKKPAVLNKEQTQNADKRERTKHANKIKHENTLETSERMRCFEHILVDGSQCLKKHRPDYVIEKHQRELTNKVLLEKVFDLKAKQRRHSRPAEAAGQSNYQKILRRLYKNYGGHLSPQITDHKILKWFNINPEKKEAAISALEQFSAEVKLLFKPGTLEFNTPTTFKAIPCQVIYHEIEPLNKHLRALAAGKNNNFVPLEKSNVKGSYLHKTFCLACRTNFGQRRELKAHIEATHQAKMKEAFDRIKAIQHRPTDAVTLTARHDLSLLEGLELPPVEESSARELPPMVNALYGHLSV